MTERSSIPTGIEVNGELQAFCDRNNAMAKRIGEDWWYRVVTIPRPGGKTQQVVDKLTGLQAIEHRRVHDEAVQQRKAAAGQTRLPYKD